ncbi:MAG TPA: SRPBCC domain-containing protein [Pseudonocardiaceae bacterium]
MVAFHADVKIDASPEEVWQVLLDGAGYPTWDSGVARVEGTIAAGERITVYSEVRPDRGFPVGVRIIEPARKMRWIGGLPMGLFSGVRTFTLLPTDDGGTFFDLREEYDGVLLFLMRLTLPDLQPSFDKFVLGLKRRVERGPAPSEETAPADGDASSTASAE